MPKQGVHARMNPLEDTHPPAVDATRCVSQWEGAVSDQGNFHIAAGIEFCDAGGNLHNAVGEGVGVDVR